MTGVEWRRPEGLIPLGVLVSIGVWLVRILILESDVSTTSFVNNAPRSNRGIVLVTTPAGIRRVHVV